MQTIYAEFENLNSSQTEDIFRLRQQVFIIEQNCIYPDIDGLDSKAQHLLIYDDEHLAAYLRIFKAGLKYQEASIGRIIVDVPYRGSGLGARLIERGISLCEGKSIRIEAQAALRSYYNKFGFQEEGEIYAVDGIAHLQMVLHQP